jgi:hypothetical protein
MTNKQDKILAGICVILLIFSIAFFSVIKSTEVIEEPVTEALSATREYTAGIATNMNADVLYGLLNDNDTTNDPYILSIRSLDHYVLGHIPGAVNTPLKELFSEENLAKLPTDRQIVVYCYTGRVCARGRLIRPLRWGNVMTKPLLPMIILYQVVQNQGALERLLVILFFHE